MQQKRSNTASYFAKTYEASTRDFLEAIHAGATIDPRTDGIYSYRRHAKNLQLDHACPVPDGVEIVNHTTYGRNGPIPVRIYRRDPSDAPKPILIYLHGGAWVIGGLDEYDGVCAYIAKFGNVRVISVDYRLAPEHKFPAAVEDCYDSVLWAAENSEGLGGLRNDIMVAGDSAGGNLAAVTCQMARAASRPLISRQLLFYPCLAPLDPDKHPSRAAYGGRDNFLNEEAFQYMLGQYLGPQDTQTDPRLWPSLANDLSGLPDGYIVTAEYDMLRDEARSYGDALVRGGARVVQKEYPGTIHGFMGFARTIKPGREALDDVCAYLQHG